MKSGSPVSRLSELTSRFYTIIPHDFGRRVPPVIRDSETLQKKFDMLLVSQPPSQASAIEVSRCCHDDVILLIYDWQVLGDIEIAQGIERDKEKKQKEVN